MTAHTTLKRQNHITTWTASTLKHQVLLLYTSEQQLLKKLLLNACTIHNEKLFCSDAVTRSFKDGIKS